MRSRDALRGAIVPSSCGCPMPSGSATALAGSMAHQCLCGLWGSSSRKAHSHVSLSSLHSSSAPIILSKAVVKTQGLKAGESCQSGC
jgi:hypothetical protein